MKAKATDVKKRFPEEMEPTSLFLDWTGIINDKI